MATDSLPTSFITTVWKYQKHLIIILPKKKLCNFNPFQFQFQLNFCVEWNNLFKESFDLNEILLQSRYSLLFLYDTDDWLINILKCSILKTQIKWHDQYNLCKEKNWAQEHEPTSNYRNLFNSLWLSCVWNHTARIMLATYQKLFRLLNLKACNNCNCIR